MTPEKEFDVGDVVQLKAGGPWMTVDRIDGDQAICLWHDGQLLRREAFLLAELTFAEIKPGDVDLLE
ncbi:MAG TPA: DUF2158 domain-containing protein [Pirellulales bacterium]|jgi:uncharacterized protein YodC (DUF2158 family)|nr:DUF2158 domain-containing protein [Pirellulales bacterium]